MPEINIDRLRDKIVHSKNLTALEKRYLEHLIEADSKPERSDRDVDETDR